MGAVARSEQDSPQDNQPRGLAPLTLTTPRRDTGVCVRASCVRSLVWVWLRERTRVLFVFGAGFGF